MDGIDLNRFQMLKKAHLPPPARKQTALAVPGRLPRKPATQIGLPRTDSFQPARNQPARRPQEPVGSAMNRLNTQAANRAGAVNSQLARMDALHQANYRAWGFHKLIKEILDIWKPR